MVPVTLFSGDTVVVFGFGLSGRVACLALQAGGAKVWVGDDSPERRSVAAQEGFSVIHTEQVDWGEVRALVLSPGIPLLYPSPHSIVLSARKAGVQIVGDTELFERTRAERAKRSRLIAITGTNGKSTTTALIAQILQREKKEVHLGGNIGVPVLSLDDVSDESIYVHEYSSYQIDLTPSVQPDVAVLLNLSPDHLDRYGSMENYAASKEALVTLAASRSKAVVIGVDDPMSRAIAENLEKRYPDAQIVPVSVHRSLKRGVCVQGGKLYSNSDSGSSYVGDLKGISTLQGFGNWQNAAAAFAVCQILGLAEDQIFSWLADFPGLRHRAEFVGQRGRVRFINDSKATNANASAGALASFSSVYWILGGRPKEGGIESLIPLFPNVVHAFLIGEAAPLFRRTLSGKVNFSVSGDLRTAFFSAVEKARASQEEEPVILFSPACASFDQFPNFEERGEAFRDLFKELEDA